MRELEEEFVDVDVRGLFGAKECAEKVFVVVDVKSWHGDDERPADVSQALRGRRVEENGSFVWRFCGEVVECLEESYRFWCRFTCRHEPFAFL